MLVTDHSGSMAASDVQPTRLAAAVKAANTFIDQLPSGARVGAVAFSSAPDTVQGPVTNHGAARSVINAETADGATATGDALALALQLLHGTNPKHPPSAVVLLSDGAANTGPLYYPANSPYLLTPCHQGITSSQVAHAAGTSVYSIGYDVGHDICQKEIKGPPVSRTAESPAITGLQALQGIASDPTQFYNQPNAAELNTAFSAVANDILHGASRLIDDNAQ
jgi:Ca-activated chloride channel family protein